MAAVPEWRLAGEWFDLCRCRVPCACTFAQPPDEGVCEGVLAWQIHEGRYGDVVLDGLNLAAVATFEGNIWAGAKATIGFFVDERADDAQWDAIETIFGGRAGGWPAGFAELIEDHRGFERAAIEIEIADDLGHWRLHVPGKARARAEALTGPTSPPGTRVQVLNPPGSEVGPGQIGTWAIAEENEADAFGMAFSWPGRSSKHFPFEWSGPEGA